MDDETLQSLLSFDDFLQQENIKISEDEITELLLKQNSNEKIVKSLSSYLFYLHNELADANTKLLIEDDYKDAYIELCKIFSEKNPISYSEKMAINTDDELKDNLSKISNGIFHSALFFDIKNRYKNNYENELVLNSGYLIFNNFMRSVIANEKESQNEKPRSNNDFKLSLPEIIFFLTEIKFFDLEIFQNKDEVFKKRILQLITRGNWEDTQKYYNSLDPNSIGITKQITKRNIDKVLKFIRENKAD